MTVPLLSYIHRGLCNKVYLSVNFITQLPPTISTTVNPVCVYKFSKVQMWHISWFWPNSHWASHACTSLMTDSESRLCGLSWDNSRFGKSVSSYFLGRLEVPLGFISRESQLNPRSNREYSRAYRQHYADSLSSANPSGVPICCGQSLITNPVLHQWRHNSRFSNSQVFSDEKIWWIVPARRVRQKLCLTPGEKLTLD